MCFHTSQTAKVKTIEHKFKVKISDETLESYFDTPQYHLNGFTHPNMLVIPQQKPEVLAPGVWGIVPDDTSKDEITSYYKEAVKFGGGLNARSEKAFQHFIYKDAIMERRCIIPVSGFFEPHEYKAKKYPYFFKNEDESPLALAGLYSVIDTYITFTILTKEASPLFARIHNKKNRQPLILGEAQTASWLSSDTSDTEIKDLLKFSYNESLLQTYTVNKAIFSPKEDSNVASSIVPFHYPEFNTLF
ncbi:SOS response-associated peptidase [Formosa sediminum]|uniref:Abasic site processing protein n=1 Tax=Formosa sediminum TaxID=2594004 RepID=A0A516GUS1_9FLAO|nr:SOS response-associated peptidase [Formosa sediminum]QDO95274.1 SOS response-associated peptidase [Formosa sediminum]